MDTNSPLYFQNNKESHIVGSGLVEEERRKRK
jgi:hypothetical protein